MTTPFWFNDPTILFKNKYILQLWPLESMNTEQKLNSISRLIILLTILGYILTKTFKILITGLVTLVVIILLYKFQTDNKKKHVPTEPFTNLNLYNAMKSNLTLPTEQNPAMNVLLPEIQDNPTRPEAAPAYNKYVEADMDNSTKEFTISQFNDPNIGNQLFNDLGDNFRFDQSMRTWYATANTTIPNDQEAFAEFCYGDTAACKDGKAMCLTPDNNPDRQTKINK